MKESSLKNCTQLKGGLMMLRPGLSLLVVLLHASASLPDAVAETATAKPNIVFILADDLGFTDVACFGSRYCETPNIDRLAMQGMKLLSRHHCQNCTPTRVALVSGQYLADFLTDKAIDFMTRHKDQPFFLYLPHFGVHSPYEAKAELVDRFQLRPGAGGHNNATYAAMIALEPLTKPV